MRTALALLLIGLTMLLPARSVAQPPSPEVREKEALAACDSRQVDKGIEILGRLWAETLEPAYIYNQGRCYQKNAMSREALGRFREFLRLARDPDDPVVRRAQQFVTELEAELAAQDRARATAPPSPAIPELSAPADHSSTPAADKPSRPVYRRPWFWILAGAVVAGGVTAVLLATRPGSSPPLCGPECNFPPVKVRWER